MESRLNPERPSDGVQPPPAPPAAPPPAADAPAKPESPPDAEALRGTRFEFGGRRPYSFSPPRVDPNKAGGRPLPGIGTVALGRVSRVAPFGAFVDFLGFRGMIHISQLLPGYRVERVEDVVQLNDEVQVRVIGVDPERRHINLALVTKLAPGASPPAAPPAAHAAESAPAQKGPASPPAGLEVAAASSQERESPTPAAAPPPDVSREEGDTPGGRSDVERGTRAAEEVKRVAADEGVKVDPPRQAPRPVEAAPPPAPARPVQPMPRPAATVPLQRPPQVPAQRPAPPLGRPQPAPKAPPAAVAQHGARSVRRELADPRHPMARLLATGGEASIKPRVDKDRMAPEELIAAETPVAPPKPVAPEPPRPVHVFGPDPEPEDEQPATLEALAARFGARRDLPTAKGQPKPADRSRQEREKQAQILAKLRQEAAKYSK